MTESLLCGVQEDLDKLVFKFSSMRSYDFHDFTCVWNELKFYYIYCGRPTELEMRFFTQNVLMFAKNMVLNKDANDWERVGALYLLHCLYYTQPLLKTVEIRINHEELKYMIQFINSCQAKCFDPVYAFMKLCFDNAFHFVYCDIPKTIEKAGKVDLNVLNKLNDEVELKEQRWRMLELIKRANIDEKEWRHLENEYNSNMVTLSQMEIGPNKLSFATSDFFKELFLAEKTPTAATLAEVDRGETSQEAKPSYVVGKRARKQRLVKMMVEGLLTMDEEVDEAPHPDGESLPILDSTLNT